MGEHGFLLLQAKKVIPRANPKKGSGPLHEASREERPSLAFLQKNGARAIQCP